MLGLHRVRRPQSAIHTFGPNENRGSVACGCECERADVAKRKTFADPMEPTPYFPQSASACGSCGCADGTRPLGGCGWGSLEVHLCGRPFRIRIRKQTFAATSDIRKWTPHCPHTFRTVQKVCGSRSRPQAGSIHYVCGCGSADADCGHRTRWSPSVTVLTGIFDS
jgi:hypothetical protein